MNFLGTNVILTVNNNMNIIPVYAIIKKDLTDEESKRDLTSDEKQSLVVDINSMDKTGMELIYALIRSYEHDHNIDNTIPYNGRIQKSGIRFELENFTILLKRILFKFMEMHKSSGQ